MKERNILKRCEDGWLVGLDEENVVVVQSPEGVIGFPVRHNASHRGSGFYVEHAASLLDSSGKSVEEATSIPDHVMHFVGLAWSRLNKARRAEGTLTPNNEEFESEEVEARLTLRELGFNGNPKVA